MDAYVKEFITMDTKRKEWLSPEELDTYQEQKKKAKNFRKEWQAMFDKDNSEKVTLGEVCRVRKVDIKTARQAYGDVPDALKYVEVIETDMTEDMRENISRMIDEELIKYSSDEAKFIKSVKRQLDERYGQLWHVFSIYGKYYSFYTYELGYNFTFKKNERIFIVFKTPELDNFEHHAQ